MSQRTVARLILLGFYGGLIFIMPPWVRLFLLVVPVLIWALNTSEWLPEFL